MSPCRTCQAKCCKYFTVRIDTPRSKRDFENIRWYLTHKGTFVEKKEWFLDIANECKYIDKDHMCSIYTKRPLVCREHESEDCEHVLDELGHDMLFGNMEELDKYIEKRFKRKTKVRTKK